MITRDKVKHTEALLGKSKSLEAQLLMCCHVPSHKKSTIRLNFLFCIGIQKILLRSVTHIPVGGIRPKNKPQLPYRNLKILTRGKL